MIRRNFSLILKKRANIIKRLGYFFTVLSLTHKVPTGSLPFYNEIFPNFASIDSSRVPDEINEANASRYSVRHESEAKKGTYSRIRSCA